MDRKQSMLRKAGGLALVSAVALLGGGSANADTLVIATNPPFETV